MRVLGIALVTGAVLLAGSFAIAGPTAEGHGVSPAKLTRAGWDCFNVPGLGVHCTPPGAGASDATLSLLVFDTDDPTATHADFHGTELLIRADLYNGQPCPQEGLDEYEFLPSGATGLGADYYACHHG